MEPDFWHQRWQQGQIGWHEDEINAHLREHWPALAATARERVLVPLCGKSLDLLWLAAQGHRVLGVELSPLAVAAFFDDNGLTPERVPEPPFERWRCAEIEILCGDFFDLAPAHLDGVRRVYDRASLIALPPPMRPRYAEHLTDLLGPDAAILLITLDYPQHEMAGPPFSVSRAEVDALFGARFAIRHTDTLDVLDENPRFRERGLTRLTEQVYVMTAK